MLFLFIFLLIGAGATAYGIWEQKNVYGRQHETEAEVVGHRASSSSNLMVSAMNAVSGIVNPMVAIDLPDGIRKVVPLHNQIAKDVFRKFPELDVGGKVSVIYFGENPKEAFLTQHPVAFGQKPMRTSPILLIGIVFLILAAGLAIVYFYSLINLINQ